MNEITPFDGVPAPLRAAMEKRGFTQLSAVQQAVLSAEGNGRNLRISSQTGSGKTVALGLRLAADFMAAAQKADRGAKRTGPLALLIAPTRELAAQVAGELRWLFEGIPDADVEVVTGGTDQVRERRALARRPGLVVGTPGRLLDHMRSRALTCANVEHVVLDEADQMLDMGFREELEAILEQLPAKRHSHLVSATFPHAVRRLADRFQNDPLHVQGTRLGEANADIKHIAHRIRPRDLEDALVNVLLLARGERALVFVRRRVDATQLAERLAKDGFSALPCSGELTQAQRTQTLNAFKSGSVEILISTDVAARGIDIPNIGMVIHADVPTDAETYTHRSGRTGRAGKKGRSILLAPAHSERHVKRVFETAKITADWQSVPTPEQIQRALTKQTRRRLHTVLDSDEAPSEKQATYAKLMLENRDPVEVIATLLQMVEPKLPRPPANVAEVSEATRPTRTSQNGDRGPRGPYQRFEINWGKRQGASTNRVLSHICRRGDLTSKDVGAIKIDQSRTTFEISADQALTFEKRSATPDERDPGLLIRRVRSMPGSSRSKKPLRWQNHQRPDRQGSKNHRAEARA